MGRADESSDDVAAFVERIRPHLKWPVRVLLDKYAPENCICFSKMTPDLLICGSAAFDAIEAQLRAEPIEGYIAQRSLN